VDFRAALLEQNNAFSELIRKADPDTPIPTCPGWTLTQLLRHVGRGDRWSAQIIRDRADGPIDPGSVAGGKPPADIDGIVDWLHGGPRSILDAVVQVGEDTPVWTFTGPRPAGWWIRRRTHEVVVHRADAALAVAADYQLAPDVAADAVTEWCELATALSNPAAPPLAAGQSLHLHATEDGLGAAGEWTLSSGADGLSWAHDHGKGTVALRGPAKDLLLALTRRRTAAELGVEVFGDSAVWDRWLAETPF
jgi:uncharacterized protein (TIGR03083 family)